MSFTHSRPIHYSDKNDKSDYKNYNTTKSTSATTFGGKVRTMIVRVISWTVVCSFLAASALALAETSRDVTCSAVKLKFEQDGYTDAPLNFITG